MPDKHIKVRQFGFKTSFLAAMETVVPVTYYSHSARYPVGQAEYEKLYFFQDSERSPRVNGKLALRANPWSLQKVTRQCSNWRSNFGPISYPVFSAQTNHSRILRARAVAESDLRGALARKIKNKEVASLGVSLASAKQSIDMLCNSASQLTKVFSAVERFYQTTKGKRRLKRFRRMISRGANPSAGMVLEGFFGWAPLFQDFASAAAVLSNPWPNASYVSAKVHWKAVSDTTITKDASEFWTWTSTWSATGHSAYSCSVTVTNPSLWIGNRLGLINPFSVAWDLVPWSFLVNMVTNMGQIMGSLTDFAGVTLSNTSLTTSLTLSESVTTYYSDPRPGSSSGATGTADHRIRSRVVGVPPPEVTPYLRFPEWNVGAAAIVGSLLIQQVSKLSWAHRDSFGPQ